MKHLRNAVAVGALLTLILCAGERLIPALFACLFTLALLACAVAPLFMGKDNE